MKGEKRVQTLTVDGSSSASTSQRVALSSAASVSELKWPHPDRFETLSAAVNVPPVSLPFIRECCIPEWMNRAYRCTCRGTALRSSRCAPVLTDWCGRREGSFTWHSTLPSLYSTLLPPLFLSLLLRLSSYPTLPSRRPCLDPTLSLLRQTTTRSLIFLALSNNVSNWLIPAGAWEREGEREKKRQTRLEARHLWVYLNGTEGVSDLGAGPTPPNTLWNEQLLACTREGCTACTCTRGDKQRYRQAASFHQLCAVGVCLRKRWTDCDKRLKISQPAWSVHWWITTGFIQVHKAPSKSGTQLHLLTLKDHPLRDH